MQKSSLTVVDRLSKKISPDSNGGTMQYLLYLVFAGVGALIGYFITNHLTRKNGEGFLPKPVRRKRKFLMKHALLPRLSCRKLRKKPRK